MSEYIFQPENNSSSLTSGIEDMCALLPNDWYGTIHDEIVRCRDCKRVEYCCFVYEYDYEPNGFCAWGERREVKPYVKPRTIENVLEEFYHAVLNHDMDNTRLEQYADEIRELMEMGARPWEVER